MVTYETLGIRRVINAHNTLTAFGGSLMPPQVLAAMEQASHSFVDMHDLLRRAGAHAAQLTRNEDALLLNSASSGMMLSALAAITGPDISLVARALEHGPHTLPRREIIMHRCQRIPYDPAFTLAGARIVEIGNAIQTFEWELTAAINEATAAIVYVAGEHLRLPAIPFERVIEIAAEHDIPVIVDSAAQLPPRENLWRFTSGGAAAAVFSGGKELRGPQASGLMVGSREFLDSVRLHAFPWQRFGRVAKIGKEEIMGLLTALELWLARDTDADLRRAEQAVGHWGQALEARVPGLVCVRDWPGEAGRPMPRLRLSWDGELYARAERIDARLQSLDPAVIVFVADSHSLWINPELVADGDLATVVDSLVWAFESERKVDA